MINTIDCLLNNSKTNKMLSIVSYIASIDDYNMVFPNIYLGNIRGANDTVFLNKNGIESIVNCTEEEPYNIYFDNKSKYRLSVSDSKDVNNIHNFKMQIVDCIIFIDECLTNNKPIYIHCYWGLMRSACVVASYLIMKYRICKEDAIRIIKEQRPRAIPSLYNFNEILEFVEEKYK